MELLKEKLALIKKKRKKKKRSKMKTHSVFVYSVYKWKINWITRFMERGDDRTPDIDPRWR